MENKIKLGGILDFTTVDWSGKIASIIFLYGCNFKCPYCFNYEMVIGNKFQEIEISKIIFSLEKNKDFVDSVVICGGEPTIHKENLILLCSELKKSGFKIKLDTNGSNPDIIKKIIQNNLADYIALDIKSNFDEKNYKKISGGFQNIEKIKETYEFIISSNIDYECRIPVIPNLNQNILKDIANDIKDAKVVVLEQFISEKTLDENLRNSKIPSREELLYLANFFKNKIIKIRTKENGEEIVNKLNEK